MNINTKALMMAGCAALILASCSTPKNIAYLPNLHDGKTLTLADTKGITLKPADRLSIVVNTKSVELNNVLNLPTTSQIIGYSEAQSLAQSRGTSGYTIDPEGCIDFPVIGSVKAAGMTRSELAGYLKRILNERHVANDAVVTVEYLNLGFSVIGEVKQPGFFAFGSDKVSLLQALSLAGDMTIYGNRREVTVLRTDNGRQDTYVIDLLDATSLTQSPAYYLQQNDVVYVQPNNYRKRQSTASANEVTTASFWLSALSVLTTIAVLIFK